MPPDRWQRPKAAWREDEAFCREAEQTWPEEYALAQRGGYDKGAAQKMTYRHQGYVAAMRKVAGVVTEERLKDAKRKSAGVRLRKRKAK